MKYDEPRLPEGNLSPTSPCLERRFKSRRELYGYEKLKRGDKVWMNGDWKAIPDRFIGIYVENTACLYGCNPRPTFGRRRPTIKLSD